jgi:hypothetical protein
MAKVECSLVLLLAVSLLKELWRLDGLVSVADFKADVESVSEKFARADKRKNSLSNLSVGRPSTIKRKPYWKLCVNPGVPCDCRASFAVEDKASSCKNLVAACCQLKCVLTVSR